MGRSIVGDDDRGGGRGGGGCCCMCTSWFRVNRAAHWTPASVALLVASAVALSCMVLADVLFLLELDAIAASAAEVAADAARAATLGARFPGGNATAITACDHSAGPGGSGFLTCALGAYAGPQALAVAYYASVPSSAPPNGSAGDGGYASVQAEPAFWTYTSEAVAGTCLYTAAPDWGATAGRLAVLAAWGRILVGISGGVAVLVVYLRGMARDRGGTAVSAELSLALPVCINAVAVWAYLSVVNVASQACWTCLAAPVCASCAAAVPPLFLAWFCVATALRLAHAAEVMLRACLSRDRPWLSAVALVLSAPAWLPLMVSALTAVSSENRSMK